MKSTLIKAFSALLAAALVLGAIAFGISSMFNAEIAEADSKTPPVLQSLLQYGDTAPVGEVPETEEDNIKEIVTARLTDFRADCEDIPAGEERTVRFIARLEAEEIPENCGFGVYAVGNDELICGLNDNGENGDEKAGDKIYSGAVNLSSEKVKVIEYIARASDEEAIKSSNRTKISFYDIITAEEFESFEKMRSLLWNMEYSLAKMYVRSSEEIASYSINEKTRSLSFTTKYGITCVWEETKDYTVEEAEAAEIKDSTLLPTVTKTNILVIRPFKGDVQSPDAFSNGGESLKTALSGELTVADNDAVTLEFMKSLADYGVILIDTDGVLVKNEIPYIILGEEYSENAELSADLQAGRICIVNNRYAVNGDFFYKYYEAGDLNESLWFIGSSYGTYNQYITNALLAKGAETLIGFREKVSQKYLNDTVSDFIGDGLLTGDTVYNSLERADRNYKEQYPDEVIESGFDVKGNSDFCLMKQEEIKEEKAEEKPTTPETKEEKKSYVWLIVLIVLVMVLAGASVVWFIILPKYKKSVDEAEEESKEESK